MIVRRAKWTIGGAVAALAAAGCVSILGVGVVPDATGGDGGRAQESGVDGADDWTLRDSDADGPDNGADATTNGGADATTDGGGVPCTGSGKIFCVTMDGAHESPAVVTAATGGLDRLTYNDTTNAITGNVAFRGLSGAPTGAHIHSGACGNAGQVLFTLDAGTAITGSVAISQSLTFAQFTDLFAGRWYLNIHTTQHPSGEIRGQLLPIGASCP